MLTRLFAFASVGALVAAIAIGCGPDTAANPANDDAGTNPSDGGDGSTFVPNSTSDGGDAGSAPAPTFVIGGTIQGLVGTGMVLQNKGGDDVIVNANGPFAFPTKVGRGTSFAISVKTQPSGPSQTCTVSGGTGTIIAANVATVVVNCDTNKFTVGGTVSGLAGGGLVLQNNAGDDIPVGVNGTFAFPALASDGSPYAVTVKTQPTNLSQTCTVTNGSGSVASADVTSVEVACVTNKFTVGGAVTGVAGSGLVLQNNGGSDVAVNVDGSFTFAPAQFDGTTFAVSVKTQPSNPLQTCSVAGGAGTIAGGNVSTVSVNCSTSAYTVGGNVSGLAGGGLVLQNNAGDDIPVSVNGSFSFATPIADLGNYAVTVKTQPTNKWQTCTVTNGSGTIAGGAISNVAVACTTNSYKVNVTVSGLAGNGLVLQNNAGDDLPVATDGTLSFATSMPSGDGYLVSVLTNPNDKSQTCSVTNGIGNVAGGDVTDVTVSCVTNSFTVGGVISGLDMGEVVITNNGGDDLTLNGNGAFSFVTSLASGATYAVAIKETPATYSCSVTNESGTVGSGPITDILVSCTCAGGYIASAGLCILPPTGGTITTAGGFRIHTFASSSTFDAPTDVNVEYLVVAGGGGGGSGDGAGGGGGGGLTGSTPLSAGSFSVVVGAGGAGAGLGEIGVASMNGSDSSFAGFVAIGGGRGGQEDNVSGAGPLNLGGNGGSGGGFGGANASADGAPGQGVAGQGFAGGVRGSAANHYGMGGGGGAGGSGGNGNASNQGGAGGLGLQSSISGTAKFYAGGGGGSGRGISGGAGGSGVGGAGGLNASGSNGTPNTGGGGGGGGDQGTTGGSGGSGIVIIRYPYSP